MMVLLSFTGKPTGTAEIVSHPGSDFQAKLCKKRNMIRITLTTREGSRCSRRHSRRVKQARTLKIRFVITDAIKDGIGRPRPHFYARCFGSPLANATYDATGNVVCILPPSLMKEAYRSFPSGHTSWSFAGLGYLAMYLAG
ncbi:hypothetical protein KC19_6G145200 [Ceratodon purpureus]|uniref:Phosphatidic acid phosphatase type 2/haloperoxidase domain-containing protein n=1 Tax=Ceratodon purpureus TaxID=3225 RepID=A0A8T0HIX3_CERPU|nr:hypothetical protein KC19_6G145200 [Ceratodon purpureus]